jgi:hypothetical protein
LFFEQAGITSGLSCPLLSVGRQTGSRKQKAHPKEGETATTQKVNLVTFDIDDTLVRSGGDDDVCSAFNWGQ